MKSINKEIADLINRHISIQKGLKRGIINSRALARFLIERYNLPYSLDAVISSIRRYDTEDINLFGFEDMVKNVFRSMAIHTKDNVARILLKDKAFKEISSDYLGKKILKENCRLVKSKEAVTLIVTQKDIDQKLSLFLNSDILKVEKNLSEIRLQFNEDISEMKGVFARISQEIAIRNINIVDVIYGIPDLLLYVNEKDLLEVHKALMELKK